MESEKIDFLLSLIDFNKTSRQRVKLFENIEKISGYDLVFILGFVIRSKFSGNLIVINENDEFSGVTFIDGAIVKIDFPDQQNLIGNLIVQEEILSADKLQQIMKELSGQQIGRHLIEKKYITERQLELLLFKQSKLRLAKYMTDTLIAVSFNFADSANQKALVTHSGYYEILYAMLFQYYQPEWLKKYSDYYAKKYFFIPIINEELSVLESFDLAWPACEKLQKYSNKCLAYKDLILRMSKSDSESTRLLHFLVLTGVVLVKDEMMQIEPVTQTAPPTRVASANNQAADLKLTKKYLLEQRPLEAFAVLNKYSTLINTSDLIHFYFLWIKIHGAFYNNYALATDKITAELAQIKMAEIGQGEYYYVRALFEAKINNTDDSLLYYSKAVASDISFVNFPIVTKAN